MPTDTVPSTAHPGRGTALTAGAAELSRQADEGAAVKIQSPWRGRQARAEGHNGIIYRSVRHEGGTCIAALWPNVVQSVVQGAMYRLTWSGAPEFAWETV